MMTRAIIDDYELGKLSSCPGPTCYAHSLREFLYDRISTWWPLAKSELSEH